MEVSDVTSSAHLLPGHRLFHRNLPSFISRLLSFRTTSRRHDCTVKGKVMHVYQFPMTPSHMPSLRPFNTDVLHIRSITLSLSDLSREGASSNRRSSTNACSGKTRSWSSKHQSAQSGPEASVKTHPAVARP